MVGTTLLIGNGVGGRLAVFLNQKNGTFEPSRSKILLRTNWDQTMALPVYTWFTVKTSPFLSGCPSANQFDQLPVAALYDFKNQKTSRFAWNLMAVQERCVRLTLTATGHWRCSSVAESYRGIIPIHQIQCWLPGTIKGCELCIGGRSRDGSRSTFQQSLWGP